ncbi:MAG TPA: hypothetical protein VEB22_06630 [Phycisphaerales bacterium]|nr:hypothetical protein [Phycisphaerales bacterium]
MPSLIATILNAEESKGAPLTREEVEAIRDKCPCVMGPVWMIAKMAESRGYEDIDPERAWEEWQEARRSLVDGSA